MALLHFVLATIRLRKLSLSGQLRGAARFALRRILAGVRVLCLLGPDLVLDHLSDHLRTRVGLRMLFREALGLGLDVQIILWRSFATTAAMSAARGRSVFSESFIDALPSALPANLRPTAPGSAADFSNLAKALGTWSVRRSRGKIGAGVSRKTGWQSLRAWEWAGGGR